MNNKFNRIISTGLVLLIILGCVKTNVKAECEECGVRLHFPVNGKIIKGYSTDLPVYYETLQQYKPNPSIMIGVPSGTEVSCATKGTVIAVSELSEVGYTVWMDIGNGYQAIYGQLKKVRVSVGDIVEKGDIFAEVATPTEFYLKEGSHLYFQVLRYGKPVNPLSLIW